MSREEAREQRKACSVGRFFTAVRSLMSRRAFQRSLRLWIWKSQRALETNNPEAGKSRHATGRVQIRMADPERLELPTPAFEAQCSIQLSYGSDFCGLAESSTL